MAKLAEDNWVTAMAWRQQMAASNASPEGPTDISDRWVSARATARQSRRINSGSGDAAAAAYRTSPSSALSPARDRSGAAGGSGWERPGGGGVVVGGDGCSERSEEEGWEEGPRTALAPGRQSGGFSL